MKRTDAQRMDFLESFVRRDDVAVQNVSLCLTGGTRREVFLFSLNPRRNLAVKSGSTVRDVIDAAMDQYEAAGGS